MKKKNNLVSFLNGMAIIVAGGFGFVALYMSLALFCNIGLDAVPQKTVDPLLTLCVTLLFIASVTKTFFEGDQGENNKHWRIVGMMEGFLFFTFGPQRVTHNIHYLVIYLSLASSLFIFWATRPEKVKTSHKSIEPPGKAILYRPDVRNKSDE